MDRFQYNLYVDFLANTGSNVNIVTTELETQNVKIMTIHERVLFEAVRELDTRLKTLENK